MPMTREEVETLIHKRFSEVMEEMSHLPPQEIAKLLTRLSATALMVIQSIFGPAAAEAALKMNREFLKISDAVLGDLEGDKP